MNRKPWLLPLACFGLALAARNALKLVTQKDLVNAVAVVTGGSRGLGLAIARELAAEGCQVVLAARDTEELERAQQDIFDLTGTQPLTVQCDVSNRQQVRDLVAHTVQSFGTIDILVNNAGVMVVGPVETQTLEDFERAMDVMFWGTVYATLEVLPHMRDNRSGHIVNITSVGGKMSVPHLLPYSAAKFATVGFSEGLHAESKASGIHVLTVVPGLMRTGSHVNADFKGQHRQEFAWFSLAASLPFTSMSARQAARQIVSAIKTGESEIVLTWQAFVATRVHGLMPGVLSDAFGVVNRYLLPRAGGAGTATQPGYASRGPISDSALTTLGERAADDLNQRREAAR